MTKKGWIIIAVLCISILGGMIWLAQRDKVNVDNIDGAKVQTASTQSGNIADHVYGKADSKVVLVEYGDFQCPGCGSAHPVIKNVVEKYKDKIAFVFRNYPLYTAHPNAYAASAAAEAAGLQGKYWEMHNKLFEDQNGWNKLSGSARADYFSAAAEALGLNVGDFNKAVDGEAVKKKITFDTALGKKAQLTGTPTFYINNKNVGDEYVINDRIVSKGTSGAELIWAKESSFEKLVIIPALKEVGIATE